MKHAPARFQSLALQHGTCYQLDSARIADELERLELLVPEIAHNASRDLQAYALAYVERYQGDVLQLEHAREFLYAALTQAWQRAEYAAVVRLVAGLAHLASRLSNFAEAEYILQLGIAASRRTQDRQHLAYFLNRLGGLLFSHGNYSQGRRVWRIGLQLDGSSGSPLGLWEPLSSFAHIADILGNYTAARQFVEILVNDRRIDDPDSLAVAIFIRGFYARFMNDLDKACEDFSCCLRLLSCQAPGTPSSHYRQLFMMVAQAELARVQGDYVRSQEYAETALSLAQVFSDRYTLADLLIDQGLFTYRQGQFADTHATLLRLRDVARQVDSPHANKCRCYLERHLARISPESCSTPAGLHEPLSEREVEVLQFVAEGLSNREIARLLVVTSGTVKKHLEHIYIKLDVHSRTSAIARARTLKLFS